MSNSDLNTEQRQVVENFKWVDGVLTAGAVSAGVIVLAKLTGNEEIQFQNLKLTTSYVWIIGVLFTIMHFYTAWLLHRAIIHLWSTTSEDKCLATFHEITITGGFVVRGLIPRTELVRRFWGIRIYKMNPRDISALSTHIVIILVVLAIVPFNVSNPPYFGVMFLIAFIVIALNWVIGSIWVIPLSELAIPQKEATLLTSQTIKSQDRTPEIIGNPLSLGVVSAMPIVPIVLIGLVLLIVSFSFVGLIYLFLNSLGLGVPFAKLLITIGVALVLLGLVKEIRQIRKFGKFILVSSFVVLSFSFVGLILWIWSM